MINLVSKVIHFGKAFSYGASKISDLCASKQSRNFSEKFDYFSFRGRDFATVHSDAHPQLWKQCTGLLKHLKPKQFAVWMSLITP